MKDFKFKKWKNQFSDYLFSEGKTHYDVGDITSINIKGNQYQVDVATDIDYTVRFEYDGDEIKELTCNCGENRCSHMTAALILLEDEDHKYDQILNYQKAFNETYNHNIRSRLDEMDEDELITLLMKLLNHDPDLREEFFLKQKPNASSIKVTQIKNDQTDLYKDLSSKEIFSKLESRCKTFNKKLSSLDLTLEEAYNTEFYGFNDYKEGEAYPDVDKILERSYNYNERIIEIINLARCYLLERGDLEDAFKIGRSLLISLTNIEDDQAYECFSGAIDSLYNFFCDLISKLSQEEWYAFFEYLNTKVINLDSWTDYKLKEFFEPLIKEFMTEKDKLELEYRQLVNKVKNERYFNLNNHLKLIDLMKELDYPLSEINFFISKCRENAEFLHYEYEEALKEKDYSLALERLLESKKRAEFDSFREKCSRELIDLYSKLDDKRYVEELKYFLENYTRSSWTEVKEMIDLLRSSLSSDEWVEYRDKTLIQKLETIQMLEILKDEKEFEKMLEILEDNIGNISLLEKSSDVLSKFYPDEFKNLCIETLNQKMKKARNRNAYREIISDLRILSKFSDEMDLRDNLIRNWIDTYPNRTAMKDELLNA